MISCPNCNHQNPDGAVQCEACYTPLPQATTCPQCGATVQSNAAFCGQCGFNLQANLPITPTAAPEANLPKTAVPTGHPDAQATPDIEFPEIEFPDVEESPATAATVAIPSIEPEISASHGSVGATQIQTQTASLLHVQTNIALELPSNLMVIHLGKPNDVVPPDIDVSGFPNSEVVSRVHADIRVEAGMYYIEDMGSSNGTYVNHVPLPAGNRHRLRAGDRLALGKGDKVTFLFQLA